MTRTTLFFALFCVAAPAASQTAGPLPPEMSTIVVPIRASLASLPAELEKHVPKTTRDTQPLQGGFTVRYDVARDPIKLRMVGPGLHTTTTARYALEACRGRFPCISCGFDEPRREAEITLHSKLEWDASWRVRSTTKPLPVHYPKKCQVTWFDFDITRRFISPAVDQQLAIAARTIDRNVPALASIKPHAEQIWASLQTPVALADRTWLVLEPVSVALTPIAGQGLLVTSTLSLQARTRVVVGEKPAVKAVPLPALRVIAKPAASGLRVPFDLELSYDDASRLVSKEFAGKTYKVGGRDLIVESIRIGPAVGGKMQLEASIDYRGGGVKNYRGMVWLEGTPQFDAATSSVIIPDLEYTLERQRRNPFLRLVERAIHLALRARLREQARFPLGPRIAELRAEIGRALTRNLAPNVFLRGRADAIHPVSVTPLPTTLSIRIIATGAAEVDIKG